MDTDTATDVKLGWLWFDNDPKTSLEQKIDAAAGRFRQKFGQAPRQCFVNQRELPADGVRCGQLTVAGARNVLPGHLLFVVDRPAG